jgi:aminoglycoside/choline kinase family phosphotransferase
VQSEPPRAAIDALVRTAFGARARVETAEALAGDASSRRYLRLRLGGAAPAAAVLMIAGGTGISISSDELAVFDEAPREPPFLNVQRYLRSVGVAVPEVYGADGDLVLLEDVGDRTLWDAARERPPADAVDLYRRAIDELVLLETAGEQRPDPDCIAFRQRFDARLFLWELDHFLEFGFADRSSDPEQLAELRRHFESLAGELGSEPGALAHRDYHSWNLFVQDGRIRVIDFQDALLAPLGYDLATLLNDRATPRLVAAHESELLDHFLARRLEVSGAAVPHDEFVGRYHRLVFQKALKVLGRFVYLEDVKGKRGYRAMLPDTVATVRRSLEHLPELAAVRALLARSFPEVG